ncbi:MAG: hypothetical protein VW268_01470 [Rhodospirillaceae bacterium]
MPVLFAALVISLATACAPVPRAFTPGEDPSVRETLVKGTFTQGVQVNPVEGTAKLMSDLLARTTADSFEPYGVPAGVAPFDQAEYVLHGRAKRDKNPRAVPYVTILWTLSDREGVLIADLEQPVDATGDEWEFGTPEVIIRVSEDVARRVAPVIAAIAPAQAEAATTRGIFVMPVEGAPGDGDFVLTRSIAAALKKLGTKLTRFQKQAKYVLIGSMAVSPPVQGRQGVRVTWRLRLPDGKEVGKADQENTVPAGTFDTQWAPTAKLIAQAAVDGIHEIIRAADEQQRETLLAGRRLENTDAADLPAPGEGGRVLGRIQDHVVPPGAPISKVPETPKDEIQKLAEAAVGQPRPDLDAARKKSELGPGDVGGEEPKTETFQPPTLQAAKDAGGNSFLISEITGAPGNGGELLTQALRRVLQVRDQSVTDDPRQARFLIRGLVVMSAPEKGKQTVRIVWSVADQNGTQLGSAEQRNAVDAGSLDKNWGPVALDVAMGAVVGIQRVLGAVARPFARALPGAQPKKAAAGATLPWEPGKAQPPSPN